MFHTLKLDVAPTYIVDSSVINHMVSNENLLHDILTVRNSGYVQLPDRGSAVMTKLGNCLLNRGALVKNVLCVPTFKFNFLSMSKLTKELNYYVLFFPGFIFSLGK